MKKMITLLLSATVAASCLVGFAGCGDKQQTADVDSEIYAVYLASGSELSYDEWYAELLKNAKGEKGDKGDPGDDGVGIKSVTLNENGELVLEFTDGNKKNLGEVVGAAGEKGVGIERVEIDENGNLVVTLTDDTTETLGKVVGENGANGENGKGITKAEYKNGKLVVTYTDGTSDEIDLEIPQPHVHTWSEWSTVEAPTCSSVGISKRTCNDANCDSEEYKLEKQLAHTYGDTPTAVVPATCTENGVKIYVCSECGNVKGETIEAQGHKFGADGTCDVCGAEEAVKKFENITVSANNGTQELSLEGVPQGIYYLIAETDATVEHGVLTSTAIDSYANKAYDMCNPTSNEFKCVLIIKEGTTKTTITNKSGSDIDATFKLLEYTPFALQADVPVDVPAPKANDGYVPIRLDPSLVGVPITITMSNYHGNKIAMPTVRYGLEAEGESGVKSLFQYKSSMSNRADGYSNTVTIEGNADVLYFSYPNADCENLTITISLAV